MLDDALDATALAALVRDGEVHPTELVEQAIARAEAVNPKLNAIVTPMYEQARAAAKGELPDGPFRGVPFVVKDLDGFTAGVPYTMGSKFLAEFTPDHDAEVIARIRRAGVVLIGKTNCPELGILGTTEPQFRGPTANPWNLEHTPGGSSGGTGSAVAARIVPMGHGGDGGGSIRIPASANGLFGLKPTRGRVPLGPELGEGWGGYVQPGVISRTVRDSAGMLDCLAGPMLGDPYAAPPARSTFAEAAATEPGKLRIAWSTGSLFGRSTHPDCAAAVQQAAKLCAELGHKVDEAAPTIDRDALVHAYLCQVAAGVASEIDDAEGWVGRKARPSDFEPATWFLNQLGRALSAAELQHGRDLTHALGRTMGAFHQRYDVFLCATMAYPPARLGEIRVKTHERFGLAMLRALPLGPALRAVLAGLAEDSLERAPNTQVFNQTGQPAMSVPLGWSTDGLPVGVQFAGRFGDECTLFSLASQLETALPWAAKRPALLG
jgi:amidase